MHVGLNESPHFIRIAFDKKVHRPELAGVFFHLQQKGLGIHGGFEIIRKRAQVKFALRIHKVQNLRPAEQVIGGSGAGGIRREEFGKRRDDDEEAENGRADQRQPVLFELPPHQLELGGGVVLDLCFSGSARWR
jgi:hypothetical protein